MTTMTPAKVQKLFDLFEALMQEYERRHAELNREQERSVLQALSTMAMQIKADTAKIPIGLRGSRYEKQTLEVIDEYMSEFWGGRYPRHLDAAIRAGAQEVADRESEIFRLMERPGLGPSVPHVVSATRESVYGATHGTAETLTTRVARNGVRTKQEVLDGVRERIRRGETRAQIDRYVTDQLTAPGVDNVRYRTLRIIRTEFANASRTAHKLAVIDYNGDLRNGVRAIGWRLSPAHPRVDICDMWASQDIDGVGAGNYYPANLPPGHPNCLCLTVTIMDLPGAPEMQWVEAHPDQVSAGQKRYYERVQITHIRKDRRQRRRRF